MTTNNYILRDKWFENSKYLIHEAERKEDHKKVLLKTLKTNYPSNQDINQLKLEYSLLRKLKHNSVLEVLDHAPDESSAKIVLEFPLGIRLESLVQNPMDIDSFLKIAFPLVEDVAYLHSQQIIHKNLNPGNIFFNDQDGSVQLAGFELAKEVARESFHSSTEEAFLADLSYISPEQTGRMNRPLDQRSDLYSLGTILYELIAKRPPFVSEDPLSLIHCHIAKKHSSLTDVDEQVPPMISKIIDKLLAKNTDKRYQSAVGLLYDLQLCSDQFKLLSKVPEFKLGDKDVSNKFNLSSKLYGRDQDIEILQKCYEGARNGSVEIAFVSGPSGMGKSALVKEVKKYIDQNQGFFIQGKFDQIKQNTPLFSLMSAFSQLIRKILSENNLRTEHWRKRIIQAVGTSGRVLTDMIPEVKLLIGEQPALPELPAAEATTRFNLVVSNFVQVFTSREHPLCIFLDDLQWIDYTTGQWLQTQFLNQQLKHFFLIGAYRDNEVSVGHPVTMMIEHFKKKSIHVDKIKLAPLRQESIANLIGDSIKMERSKCNDVAEIIAQKTRGNPFFIRQILLSLYEKEALFFSTKKQSWDYDFQKIKEITTSDNVIELMLELLQRLPTEVLDTLKIASCIGIQFDLNTLSEVSDLELDKSTNPLSEAIQLGIIVSKGMNGNEAQSKYAFQHDKIQQAAFVLLQPENRQLTQLKIGRHLLGITSDVENSEKLYDITDHLNAGKELITDESEKRRLAELNLAASIKAQSATAYRPALDYINHAMNLIEENSFDQTSRLKSQLYLQRAQSEHLCGNNKIADRLFDEAVELAQTELDKAKVFLKKIHYYNNLGKFEQAYETGRIALSPLGTNLPSKFIPPKLISDIAKYRLLRGKRSIEDLINVPELKDEKQKMAVRIMANVTKSAYQIQPELSIAVSAKIVNHFLKHGHTDGSSIGFVAFGAIFHSAILKNKIKGFKFGQLTLDLVEKYKVYQYKAETHFVVGYFAIPWFRPATEMEQYWQTAYNTGIEVGDFFHASCAASGTTQSYFMRGLKFEETLKASELFLGFLRKINYKEGILTVRGVQQAIRNLQGKTESPISYSDQDFNEEEYLNDLANFGSRHFAHYYFINKMRSLYLWGEYNEAYKLAKLSDNYLKDSPGMLHTAEHFFYKALILAALITSAKGAKKLRWKRTLSKINRRFKKYAKDCPHNFIHKSQIIDAEYHRINGYVLETQNLYHSGYESANRFGYLHIQALANHLLTQFHHDAGNQRIRDFHLKDAIHDYHNLGASAYAEYLQGKFELSKSASGSSRNLQRSGNGLRLDSIVSNLDLKTILKSSEAISQQIRLKDLLSSMMKIIIENAGAQRMVLLIQEKGKLLVQAECISDTNEVQILSKIPYDDYEEVAKSVINYAISTNQPVVLDEAYKSEKFANDPHIANRNARSILCTLLSKTGKMTGVIYLENNLSDGVFSQDRMDLIKLLSGQIAISIENAMLYNNLEDKVKERTEQLIVEKEKSDRISRETLKVNRLLSEKNQIIKNKSDQNETLLKEIHHRVKNNLQTISSILYLQSADISDHDAKEAIAQGQHRVESMALIHNNLYQQDNLAAIEMKDYITQLISNLMDAHVSQNQKIEIKVEMEETQLDVDYAIPLGLIINELLTNIFKYAFPNDKDGKVLIALRKIGADKFNLRISDNGVGNSKANKGFGSKLVQLLTTQLEAKFTDGNDNGYWCQISSD